MEMGYEMNHTEDIRLLNQLFTDYKARFVHFANSYVQDIPVAEDFTLESFMDYWEERHRLLPDSNVPAYILTLIKHKCLNYLHRKQIQETVSERIRRVAEWELDMQISSLEVCEPTELFTEEIRKIVTQTLHSLPEQTRRAFIMSRYENKSRKEIADQLHMTTKGVEYHISKALKALRHNLKDYFIFFLLFYHPNYTACGLVLCNVWFASNKI